MFIAFEGPDNTGKSTAAANLSSDGVALYNATKSMHAQAQADHEPSLVTAYDRIDWFTHMVYRLSMPERDWNDERPRTVFAMPDTHLVVKIHRPDLAQYISDELYTTGSLARVNPMYWWFGEFFMSLNRTRDFDLFKTVSFVEVSNDPRDGSFAQRLAMYDSPAFAAPISPADMWLTDDDLLAFLREQEHQIL